MNRPPGGLSHLSGLIEVSFLSFCMQGWANFIQRTTPVRLERNKGACSRGWLNPDLHPFHHGSRGKGFEPRDDIIACSLLWLEVDLFAVIPSHVVLLTDPGGTGKH